MLPNINALISQALQNFQTGNFVEAKKKLTYVLNAQPKNFVALEILGGIYFNSGDLQKALKHFEKITKIKPDYPEAWSNLGTALLELKQYDLALASCDKAISLKYDFPEAWSNRGNALQELKQYELALASYDNAINLKPGLAEAWCNRGTALKELKQYEQALASCDKAISIKPDYAEAWLNRGNALQELKQFELALVSFDKSISLKPDYAEAWLNRGNAFLELKQYELALASCDKAISLKPDYEKAWLNRGNAFLELKQYELALASYDKAISLNPDYPEAWSNRGNAFRDIGRLSLAQASYREAIRLDPEFLSARSNLLFNLNYFEKLSSQEALDEAKKFGLKVSERAQPKFTTWEAPTKAEKLRIGFMSGDLSNHPVGYFVEGLLEHLDRSQFEILAFPTSSTSDDLTHRIKPFFNEWAPVYGMSDQVAATLIHQKGIHILIDLSGHTAHNRLAVFSYKPATVQVSYLGYFATTGLPEMDYFLGDPHMSPANEAIHFTETIWNLAETWLCHRPHVHMALVSKLPALSNGFLTFGSFGNLSKMNDQVVETWSSVLLRLPSSKLLLKSKQLGDLSQIEEVQSRFKKFDIPVERLILEGPVSREAYFEAYQRVDIVLDTFPYPGGTTSVDSLWMGVPVLTLKGDRFLSHLGESIAINAGNSDWIAADVSDYVNKAIQFASDLDGLSLLRSTLRERVLKSPLFDTTRFAKNFGQALWGMWDNRLQTKANLTDE